MSHEMITNKLDIITFDSAYDAPDYSDDFKLLKAYKAVVVVCGTSSGNPTVDIQMVDDEGNKFLIMALGGIIESLGKFVETKRILSKAGCDESIKS